VEHGKHTVGKKEEFIKIVDDAVAYYSACSIFYD
jgi:hypothetical protein